MSEKWPLEMVPTTPEEVTGNVVEMSPEGLKSMGKTEPGRERLTSILKESPLWGERLSHRRGELSSKQNQSIQQTSLFYLEELLTQ